MGLSGGLIILAVLLWQQRLVAGFRELGNFLLNWILCRHCDSKPPASVPRHRTTVPYEAAMALGIAALCWRPAG